MKNGRKVFIETITELARQDSSVVLILGDVGFSFMEPFKQQFPKQYLNIGIMEQCMMGFAAGLATAGLKPYVYTMRNFIAFRPYEQVRNDIAYANANVKLIGVAGSEAYKFLGMSHNVFTYKDGRDEDVAMMSELPNINVYIATEEETLKQDLLTEYKREAPSYFII